MDGVVVQCQSVSWPLLLFTVFFILKHDPLLLITDIKWIKQRQQKVSHLWCSNTEENSVLKSIFSVEEAQNKC